MRAGFLVSDLICQAQFPREENDQAGWLMPKQP
jgi:hypothetical protein